MEKLLKKFESKPPEIIFTWNDYETEAKGWLVINSLRGGAAGGGTRMKKGVDLQEVILLAKTMEIKFSVSGPDIGGAKSGIDFDPFDDRKQGVLNRWYVAIAPMLKNVYGTGGDLNVDFTKEVMPITEKLGIRHPQEGIVNGHFGGGNGESIITNLNQGTSKIVEDPMYTPDVGMPYTIGDLISGYSVAESVIQYYRIFGGDHVGKRALVQGWGNVGSAAGYYLAKAGVKIVGILDKNGGVIDAEGLSLSEVKDLIANRQKGTHLISDPNSAAEVENAFWHTSADIFLPCAASKLITIQKVDAILNAGIELVACGANVPFADHDDFFGQIAEYTDSKISVIPDFIANCGMARVFAYLMDAQAEISDVHMFRDVSDRVYQALQIACDDACQPTQITKRVLENAISKSLDRH
jgi:glutamate dehydrogenase/leucine dehydrogenase